MALPVKNFLEIDHEQKKARTWEDWLKNKPSKEKYCEQHGYPLDAPVCDYCGSKRQLPSLEMVIASQIKFGFFSNTFNKFMHYKTYICGGCGTELFRERHEA